MKKIITIANIFLIIVLFISNISVFIQNQTLNKKITVFNQRISELEKENQKLKDTPPLGWKEYIDNKYMFKVWYPEEAIGYKIVVRKTEEIFPDISAPYRRSFEINNPDGIRDYGVPQLLLDIHIYEQNTLQMNKFIRENLKNEINFSDKNIIIEKNNDIVLYKVEIPDEILSYYAQKDTLVFVFNPGIASVYDSLEENKKIFEIMVQSFKFTE